MEEFRIAMGKAKGMVKDSHEPPSNAAAQLGNCQWTTQGAVAGDGEKPNKRRRRTGSSRFSRTAPHSLLRVEEIPRQPSEEAARFRAGKYNAKQEVQSLLGNQNMLEAAVATLSSALEKAEEGAAPEYLLPFEQEMAKLEAFLALSRSLAQVQETAAQDAVRSRREKAELEAAVAAKGRLLQTEKARFDSEVICLNAVVTSLRAQWEAVLREGRVRLEGEKTQIEAAARQQLEAAKAEMAAVAGSWVEASKAQFEASGREQMKALETEMRRTFEEEKAGIEKRVREDALACQICMDRARNVVIFPCFHAFYCKKCLEEHREANQTCPTCRATMTGWVTYIA